MYFTILVLCAYQVTELYYYRLQEHELDAKQLAVVAVRTYFMCSHDHSAFNILTFVKSYWTSYCIQFLILKCCIYNEHLIYIFSPQFRLYMSGEIV